MSNIYFKRAVLIVVSKQLLIVCILFDVLAICQARHTERIPDVIRRKMEPKELPRRMIVDALQNGQFFQDIFSEHLAPLKIEFGHVCENPQEWEQRFERKDMENNKHQGKVRWGNKNGDYGEHYWDLNHGTT